MRPGDGLPEDQALLVLAPDRGVQLVVERREQSAASLSGEEEASVGETVAAPRLVEQVVTNDTSFPPCVENKGCQILNVIEMKTKGKSISIIPSSLATVAQALAKLSATPCLFSYKS